MMMQMLEAGGLDALTDRVREPDADNVRGYYELEKVKNLKTDSNWVSQASGKTIKIISQLLQYLPPEHTYRIVFLQRDLGEVLASQAQMLIRRGREASTQIDDDKMADIFQRHLSQTISWLAEQPNMETLYEDYARVISDPEGQANRINRFLGGQLNEKKMAGVIDGTLHRQKH